MLESWWNFILFLFHVFFLLATLHAMCATFFFSSLHICKLQDTTFLITTQKANENHFAI